ncbi:MAG: cytochrome c family protein [Alphaproteobacteria bacterium]|nr:cytochrome c family protein [Alphaproteobacteria bacterium]
MAAGQELKLPLYGADAHVGVTSCSGSTCHGAVEPFKGSNVLQNEFVTWQRDDKHSQAYAVLQNSRSQRIARNLGLENAHTAKLCLDCHADNVGSDLRGRQFQLSDGVGCEACHGGARRWLGTHVAGATHDENVKAGLYPTDQAAPRARLCLSCHFGVSSKTKFVTHQIMGAGHPRMPFELDTFTTIQPAHYVVDDDYRKRKASPSGVQVWALGQSMSMQAMLESVLDGDRNRYGVFPELVTFDCHACHHQMSQEIDLRWRARRGVGLPPGTPRFNDANLVMLRVIANRIDPALAGRLSAATVAFHKSVLENFDRYQSRARELQGVVNEMVRKVGGHGFSKDDIQAILTGLVTEGGNGELFDYASAEQATMALGALISTWRQAGGVDAARLEKLNAQLERCYAATADDELYRPADFAAAIGGFRDLIR